jgi:hypothetical protein
MYTNINMLQNDRSLMTNQLSCFVGKCSQLPTTECWPGAGLGMPAQAVTSQQSENTAALVTLQRTRDIMQVSK